MTKEDIDNYFIDNYSELENVIKSNAPKSKSVNRENAMSYVYEACLKNRNNINCIDSFVRIATANQYRWMNSEYNKDNLIPPSNDLHENYTYIEEQSNTIDEEYQELQYALAMYYKEASPHERALHDLFIKEGLRTVRQMRDRLKTSHYGAHQLLKEFKSKIKEYER